MNEVIVVNIEQKVVNLSDRYGSKKFEEIKGLLDYIEKRVIQSRKDFGDHIGVKVTR